MKNNKLETLLEKINFSTQIEIETFGTEKGTYTSPLKSSSQKKWRTNVDIDSFDKDQKSFSDLTVAIESLSQEKTTATFAVNFKCSTWNTENYLLLPASVYGGNRFPSKHFNYPPLLTVPHNYPMNNPIITDVPRLGLDGEKSFLQQLAGDMTTPSVGIYFPKLNKGLWLLTNQGDKLGDYGFTIEENNDRSEFSIKVTLPYYRKERQYFSCGNWCESQDSALEIKPGTTANIKMRLVMFEAAELSELFNVFSEIRKDLTGPVTLKNDYPFSQAWQELEKKQNRENWYPKAKLYGQIVKSKEHPKVWRSGWCGGLIGTWPLMVLGDETSRKRACDTLDTIFTKGMSPCGLFYSTGTADGETWEGNCYPYDGAEKMHLIRRSGDSLYFAIKQVEHLQQSGDSIPKHWRQAIEKCADALVKIWQENGQFGHYVNQYTGEIILGGSTAGGIVPAALAKCYQFFDKEIYLDTAIDAAEFYCKNSLNTGLTTGGPGEILQCPDSESAFGLLESYVVLYEISNDTKWLDYASKTADMCLTWCMSYDFKFPKDSLFGKLDMRSAGSVWANVQNKHSAPGICTLSGNSLLKLFRATGNKIYLETIQEIAHALPQYVSRPERPIGELGNGWINERVNTSDWERKVGGIFNGSCWPEISLMLTCLEIPGVYIQKDTGLICCFDHVLAEPNGNDQAITITNPTSYDLETTIFVENSKQCKAPLKDDYITKFKKIIIKANSSQEFIW